MQIKAIGFDWGGVIGGIRSSKIGFTEKLAKLVGVKVERWRQEYFKINHLINTGKLEKYEDFDKILLEKLGKPEKLTELTKERRGFHDSWVQTDERVVKLIKQLRAEGVKVGMLSNATRIGGEKMREIGAQKWFDVFMISAEEGLQKPDPELFKRFVGELGVEMSEFAYIDDSETSLVTAEELGYYPILYREYEELVKELENLGVLEKTGKTG